MDRIVGPDHGHVRILMATQPTKVQDTDRHTHIHIHIHIHCQRRGDGDTHRQAQRQHAQLGQRR